MVPAVTWGIRYDACLGLDVGGKEIFFSCCLFSTMAPERVLPSLPSDRGLLRGEEVVRDEILEAVGEGGEGVVIPLSRSSRLARMAVVA